MAQIKASPWPDVPVHAGRLRSPVLQEGDDWYAIDVTEPEMSGPSDPDLYNMPMVPKGPGRIDSAAEDVSSAEGQSTSAYDPKARSTLQGCSSSVGGWGGGDVLFVGMRVSACGLNFLPLFDVLRGNAAAWPLQLRRNWLNGHMWVTSWGMGGSRTGASGWG